VNVELTDPYNKSLQLTPLAPFGTGRLSYQTGSTWLRAAGQLNSMLGDVLNRVQNDKAYNPHERGEKYADQIYERFHHLFANLDIAKPGRSR
jgi:hypothetical protein